MKALGRSLDRGRSTPDADANSRCRRRVRQRASSTRRRVPPWPKNRRVSWLQCGDGDGSSGPRVRASERPRSVAACEETLHDVRDALNLEFLPVQSSDSFHRAVALAGSLRARKANWHRRGWPGFQCVAAFGSAGTLLPAIVSIVPVSHSSHGVSLALLKDFISCRFVQGYVIHGMSEP